MPDDRRLIEDFLPVLAMGALPIGAIRLGRTHLRGRVAGAHVIGDARNPSNAMEAIAAGAEVGRAI
ncbi:MAG: hypothetical protein JW753_08180 [Dehalococcoidia bacterium]|nr:hypothetical protein [Dehalococcoidia bacterium]